MSVVKYAEVSMRTHNEQEEYRGKARGACSMGWNLNWREGLQLRKGANTNINAEFRVKHEGHISQDLSEKHGDVYLEFGIQK